MVRAPDVKSVDPEFNSRSDHQLDLLQLVPGSTLRLRLYAANWSTSCQLAFLTCSVSFAVFPALSVNSWVYQ